jgi:hypothetical protein
VEGLQHVGGKGVRAEGWVVEDVEGQIGPVLVKLDIEQSVIGARVQEEAAGSEGAEQGLGTVPVRINERDANSLPEELQEEGFQQLGLPDAGNPDEVFMGGDVLRLEVDLAGPERKAVGDRAEGESGRAGRRPASHRGLRYALGSPPKKACGV